MDLQGHPADALTILDEALAARRAHDATPSRALLAAEQSRALLLADLSLRAEIGRGVLPSYDRDVLDEGHHLEDAATGAASQQLTVEAIRQAIAPLLDRSSRKGALSRIARATICVAS